MGLLLALMLSAADASAGTGVAPDAKPLGRRFGITLGLGADTQWAFDGRPANFALWSDLELSFRVLRWLRVAVISGAAWSPDHRPSYPGQHGVFRALAGVDFLAPLPWGDLFFGVAGGIQHTNLLGDENWPETPNYSTGWFSGPCLLARAGAEFEVAKNVSLGAYLAYGYFVVERVSDRRHSTELMARVSFLF